MAECGLCHSNRVIPLKGADNRAFYTCNTCSLLFADPRHHLSADQEKERYENHRNSLEDENYLLFLKRAVSPALAHLNNKMIGLDFGCGPVTAIQHILKNHNIRCDSYDPLFLPVRIQATYDFIFSTEVFEHFFKPHEEMKKLDDMLKARGYLIIMTEFYISPDHFKDWYYSRDPTHVCFYNSRTFEYICGKYNYKQVYTDNSRVIILQKN